MRTVKYKKVINKSELAKYSQWPSMAEPETTLTKEDWEAEHDPHGKNEIVAGCSGCFSDLINSQIEFAKTHAILGKTLRRKGRRKK